MNNNINNKSRWKVSGCPKCGGDIFLDSDENNLLDYCLQCGYIHIHSGFTCPKCDQDMTKEENGYRCGYCGYTCKTPKVPIPID
jgi:ribosomal protein S27AE